MSLPQDADRSINPFGPDCNIQMCKEDKSSLVAADHQLRAIDLRAFISEAS